MGPSSSPSGFFRGALSRVSSFLQRLDGGAPKGAPRGPYGGPHGGPPPPPPRRGPPIGGPLGFSAAAASLKQRFEAANEQLGGWVLKEAPPAFRLRGLRYAGYAGGPPKWGPHSNPLEQQKKANLLSMALAISAAGVLILTPVYLQLRYCSTNSYKYKAEQMQH